MIPLRGLPWHRFASAQTARLYSGGIRRIYYTHSGFAGWMAEAVLIGITATYLPLLCLGGWNIPNPELGGSLPEPEDGDGSQAVLSFAAMFALVHGVNLRLAMEVHSFSCLEAWAYGIT